MSLFSIIRADPRRARTALSGRHGHTPVSTGLEERFHDGEGSKAGVDRARRTTKRPPRRADPDRDGAEVVATGPEAQPRPFATPRLRMTAYRHVCEGDCRRNRLDIC
jgi:hypothetical protein